MIVDKITRAADSDVEGSLANRLRRARFRAFQQLVETVGNATGRPVRIVDLGGQIDYWEMMGVADDPDYDITTVNVSKLLDTNPHGTIAQVKGDATRMPFADRSFDIAFSNSVIEHVGDGARQRLMADEVRRLAPSYYVQTPARSFPIEPHFRSPLCHPWLPERLRVKELQRVRSFTEEEARGRIGGVRLMNSREFRELFPDATHTKERVAGLTKSFVAIRQAGP